MIDFATFFAAAHGRDATPGPAPYPWQSALAHRLATAAPPRAIVVPTGGGKTATIDALVWALARQAERSPLLRTIGVRTVWAIDRRILVDEVHAHVCFLAARLLEAAAAPDDVLHDVAVALQSLTRDGSPPLVATRWRGGIALDRQARHPLQPEVITSTVAQIGSRLLFRGYGVGRRSLSVQAALAAVDTTICLDEAHLAEPFRETAEAIRFERARERLALPPVNLITLTATPNATLAPEEVTTITDSDRALLGRRLTGVKNARLVEVASTSDRDGRAALLQVITDHLEAGSRTVACVVNSVKTAIDTHAVLAKEHPGVDRMLLIGPQRPADRARLLERHRATLFARARPETPLVLVATQTFEVGLDADVEALVTQSASASALVQRLGRLNRAGVRDGAATIVRDEGSWLYADEEPAAWAWLRGLERADGTIDVSVDALAVASGRPVPVIAARPPALTADVLDRLVQTEPRPAMLDDPDVDAFLRGAQSEPAADVTVAWRCDLRDDDPHATTYRTALLRLAPPQPEELLTLSVGRARALLAALGAAPSQRSRLSARLLDEPDLEGALGDPALAPRRPDDGFGYVVLRGGEHLESVPIRPGDVLVLSSRAGGYSEAALDPTAAGPVAEVAPDRLAAEPDREDPPPPFWRLSDEALAHLPSRDRRAILTAAEQMAGADTSDARTVAQQRLVARLADALGRSPEALGLGMQATLTLRRTTAALDMFAGDALDDWLGFDLEAPDEDADVAAEAEIMTDERTVGDAFVLVVGEAAGDELRPAASVPPTLEAHARAVAGRTAAYVQSSGLPTLVADTLVLAARAHDHGKSDPRIQAFFRGGNAGMGDVALAKSTFGTGDRRADDAARKAAGLPSDLRHEVESVAVLRDALAGGAVDELPPEVDRDLLLHLVGTHHGLGRPVPRLPRGGAPARPYRAQAVGIVGTGTGDGLEGWAGGMWLERFLGVTDRFGPWGSAYLGALLVLADHTISGEGR